MRVSVNDVRSLCACMGKEKIDNFENFDLNRNLYVQEEII